MAYLVLDQSQIHFHKLFGKDQFKENVILDPQCFAGDTNYMRNSGAARGEANCHHMGVPVSTMT